ncbi:ABC transporter substrate-binding protein [Chloroflexi bacterium TSY]|nr:ABC transporter substrate-binding protein [Chloroflexi bacterium TSY]
MTQTKKYPLSLLMGILSLVFAACVPVAAPSKPTIKLAENPWTGSAVNNAVAKIILEEQLGYPVEIVAIDQYQQWPAIASGELSASLEIWLSGHSEEMEEYLQEGSELVEPLGDLGVIGKIGWFIPAYMVDRNAAYATWEGFVGPEAAAEFATAQTGDKGQFIAGDPSWGQYDADIINNLDMEFEVVYAGSEQAQLAALDSAYSREEPFLFYFWTPHSAFAKYDLVNVALPEYSDECWAGSEEGGVNCDYPEDILLKIGYPGLAEEAPEAHQFLKNMQLTNEAQIEMIFAIDDMGQSAEEAAQAWVEANEEVWSTWLP